MMNSSPSPIPSQRKLDRDPRLFMGFLTLVVAVAYVLTLFSYPDVRKTGTLILFTVLITIHLVLHWMLEKVAARPKLVIGYIVVQGALAYSITWLSGNISMIFALFMGLIGEGIGLLGISRRGVLAAGYYLVLSFIGFIQFLGIDSAKWWALVTLPVVVFIAVYVRLYIRQLEARTQAQALLADLETANRQLVAYAARVEDLTIASERQRMARELHDTLSQGLAGLILQLEAVDAHLAGNRLDRARNIVRETMVQARSTLADARRAIDDLRHSGTPSLGEAVRQETDRFIAATGIPCEVDISLPATLPDLVTEAAIRAVTEALNNIARHAKAQNAILRIGYAEDRNELEIEICDDGIGFDPNIIETGHYGLLGMRERVRLAGGSLKINSETGKGTHLVIRFPLEKHADE